MQKKNLLLILAGFVLLCSCEQEIGRLDLTQNDVSEITFELEANEEIQLWTDIDIEYIKKPLFVYDCEFHFGDEFIFKGGTDPLTTSNNKNELKTTDGEITHWKYYGKLTGTLNSKEEGLYNFKTIFIRNNEPGLKINKADIVFIK